MRPLLIIANFISSCLDKGHFTMGIFVDLKKALDNLDNTTLLNKLEYYGIQEVRQSYFSDSSQ